MGVEKEGGCEDQIFALRQLSEKYVNKGRSLYVVYINLKKPMTVYSSQSL